MTNQEAFDKVVQHLKTQKEQSFGPFTNQYGNTQHSCLYRGPDGLKCAVGALIPDEEYKPEFEGLAVLSLMRRKPASLIGLDRDLLLELQRVHDSIDDWTHSGFVGWDEVRAIGECYGLDVSNVPGGES